MNNYEFISLYDKLRIDCIVYLLISISLDIDDSIYIYYKIT